MNRQGASGGSGNSGNRGRHSGGGGPRRGGGGGNHAGGGGSGGGGGNDRRGTYRPHRRGGHGRSSQGSGPQQESGGRGRSHGGSGQGRRYQSRRPGGGGPGGGGGGRYRGDNPRGRRGGGGHPHYRNRYRPSSGQNRLLDRYFQLLTRHLDARRKYYDMFNRVGDKVRFRMEQRFLESAKQLMEFEKQLPPEQLKQVAFMNSYPEDLDYSKGNEENLEALAKRYSNHQQAMEDPHFDYRNKLEGNKRLFDEDQEESEGTMEDYYKFKGSEKKSLKPQVFKKQ